MESLTILGVNSLMMLDYLKMRVLREFTCDNLFELKSEHFTQYKALETLSVATTSPDAVPQLFTAIGMLKELPALKHLTLFGSLSVNDIKQLLLDTSPTKSLSELTLLGDGLDIGNMRLLRAAALDLALSFFAF